MSFPAKGDYIDIHSHNSRPEKGIFVLENLIAHEKISPKLDSGMTYSVGIHPWFLTESNQNDNLDFVRRYGNDESVAAIGEAGFDKLKGAPLELQIKIFEEQAAISEEFRKPLIIHCVKSWDELLASRQKIKPKMPWLIHGFRGEKELATQLISRGMYLSLWYEFVLRDESSDLLRSIPLDKLFLETDGSGVDIRDIYKKAANVLTLAKVTLKERITMNYERVFSKTKRQ